MKELLSELKKQIRYYFGPKCKDYSDACCVCRIYHCYEVIHQTYGLYSHLTPDFPALRRANAKKNL